MGTGTDDYRHRYPCSGLERRGWDLNPRTAFAVTSLAGRPVRPDSGTSPDAQKTLQGGGGGIRTPGGLPLNGFQDRRIRPLCHPSREALGP